MRRLLATDFGIWPVWQNLERLTTSMMSSKDHWARLANYLLLYDQIVIPTGNLQILEVLRVMLGEDIFDELIVTKAIVLARYDKYAVYSPGQGLFSTSISRPNYPNNLLDAYSYDLEKAVETAIAMTNPQSTSERRGCLAKLLMDNIVQLPMDVVWESIKQESYKDISESQFLRQILGIRKNSFDWNNIPDVAPNTFTIFNPGDESDGGSTALSALLRVNFENSVLDFASRIDATEISGSHFSFNVLQAKGQRAGFSPYASYAFAKIQTVKGVPDIGNAFATQRLSPKGVLELRNLASAQTLRLWFAQGKTDETPDEAVARLIESMKPSIANSIPVKTLRFVATSIFGVAAPLVGAIAAPIIGGAADVGANAGLGASLALVAADTFLFEKLFPEKAPRIFLDQARLKLKRLSLVSENVNK